MTRQSGKIGLRRKYLAPGSPLLKPVAIVLTLALSLSFNLFFDHPAFAEGTNAVVDLPGCTTSTLARNDDGSTGLVDLGFSLNFFGTSYNALYVNNNGNVTFDSALSTYTPFGLSSTNRVIIAPFFADVDTRNTASGEVQYGSATFEGKPAFLRQLDQCRLLQLQGR